MFFKKCFFLLSLWYFLLSIFCTRSNNERSSLLLVRYLVTTQNLIGIKMDVRELQTCEFRKFRKFCTFHKFQTFVNFISCVRFVNFVNCVHFVTFVIL